MKIIIILMLLFVTLLFVANTISAQVVITNPLAAGGVNNFCDLLTKISTGIAGLVATLSGIMIIIAGIMYLTSAGSQEKMNTAKKALTYAIMGIVLALLAIPIVEIIKEILGASGVAACI